MDSGTQTDLEEAIPFDASAAAAVYFASREPKGPSRRHGKSDRAHHLDDDIHRILETLSLTLAPQPGKPYYLAGRTAFYDWQAGRLPGTPPCARRGVILAVYLISGTDISLDRALTRTPLNLSGLARLLPVKLRRVSNQPDAAGNERYELTVPYVRLWSEEQEVRSTWWQAPGSATDPSPVLGTIRFSVPRVQLQVTNAESRIAGPLVRLLPEDKDKPGRIEGGDLLWNGDNSWEFAVLERDAPSAILTEATLGRVAAARGSPVTFRILADPDHVHPDLRLSPTLGPKRRAEAIERLMGVVLAGRRRGMGTLSVQELEAP